jgi:hypothetical protein
MQKHKASNNARTTPFLRIVTVTIVVLGIGYFLILEPYLDNRDKQKFLDAQAFIEETYQEKILPIAEPDEVTRVEHCGYSGQKYARGNLSCRMSLTSDYSGVDYEDSFDLIEKLSAGLDDPVRGSTTNNPIDIDNIRNNSTKKNYRLFQRINDTAVSCSISYQYSSRSNISDNLSVTIGCSDSARVEHFPVE